MGIHENLKPLLISTYEDEFELLVVETKVGNQEIRFLQGMAPRKVGPRLTNCLFFVALNLELVKAKMAGKSIYISMDANRKLGPKYIPTHYVKKWRSSSSNYRKNMP